MRTTTTLALVLAAAAAADEAAPAAAKEEKVPSKLAPTVRYLDLWTFLHGTDPKLPKVLYLPNVGQETGEDHETPSWVSTAALAFKEGRVKSVSFAALAPTDASRTASRLGVSLLPSLVAIDPDGVNGGRAWPYAGPALHVSGTGTILRAVKEWVAKLRDGKLVDDESYPLPAFPEPFRPRKQAALSIAELTHETLSHGCYEGGRLCFLALLDEYEGAGCPHSVKELASRYRNDPVRFGCVGARRQDEFLAAWHVTELPAFLALKGSAPRKRFARMEDKFEPGFMTYFVEGILTGAGVKLGPYKGDLPELEAPYLLNKDEEPEQKEEV